MAKLQNRLTCRSSSVKHDVEDCRTGLLEDIRATLRLPTCDILVILDCSFSAKCFTREPFGRGHVELLASAAGDARSPAPFLPQSFTSTLFKALQRLLIEKSRGFDTSHLYREVYHTMPVTQPPQLPNTKPLHFDQSGMGLGRIILCPQGQTHNAKPENQGFAHLKLTFRLSEQPDLAVMNELALHLQYLPHIDQIRFEDLFAPRKRITDLMRVVMQAQKLRPLIRRIHARRQLRKLAAMRTGNGSIETPSSLLKLTLDVHHPSVYNWSNATRVNSYKSESSDWSQDEGSLLPRTRPSAPTVGTTASANEGHRQSDRKRRRSAPVEIEHRTSNKAQRL